MSGGVACSSSPFDRRCSLSPPSSSTLSFSASLYSLVTFSNVHVKFSRSGAKSLSGAAATASTTALTASGC